MFFLVRNVLFTWPSAVMNFVGFLMNERCDKSLRASLTATIAIIEAPYSEVADSKLAIVNERTSSRSAGRLIYSCTSEPDNSQLGRSTRLEPINAHRIAFREYDFVF